MPTTQQALLRSKISLPTQWARKLGLAPTAEVRMGWRLQRTLSQVSPSTSVLSTPQLPSGTQQFVIPSGESSDASTPIPRGQTEQSVEPVAKGAPAVKESARQPVQRRLSNTQINRIIERQVSFFRSAQRQSFLKAAQMTGGVSASFTMLGDILIAEPGALIGFAGPRVIKKTVNEELPEGFQKSEYLLEHGMIDLIVSRNEFKSKLYNLLKHLVGKR